MSRRSPCCLSSSINRDGGGKNTFTPIGIPAALHRSTTEKIHLTTQKFLKLLLDPTHLQQANARAGLEFNEQINITADMSLATGRRTKDLNTFHWTFTANQSHGITDFGDAGRHGGHGSHAVIVEAAACCARPAHGPVCGQHGAFFLRRRARQPIGYRSLFRPLQPTMISIDLSGKVALITGASQGIGAQIARTFHRAGATVVINHPGFPNTAADAQALADELNVHRTDSARVIAADVSKPNEVQSMMGEVQAACGGLDYLVNNAAIIKDRTIAKMSLDEWDAVIDVNLSGVFYGCKYAIEIMRDHGAIVSFGSIAAIQGFFGQANYASAKAGVQAMMRVLSREAARKNIRANAIAPGVIDTSMAATIPEMVRAEMLKNVPLGRFGTTDEVANVVLFLCSPLASYVTGQTIEINGGWRG